MRLATLRCGVIGVISLLGLAACSSGSASSTSTPSTAPPTTMTLAASQAAIQGAYQTLFNMSDKSVAPKLAVIQNGSALQSAITSEVHSSLASLATGAKVDSVQILGGADCQSADLPAPCAKVSYDILGTDGNPILSTPSTGYAVYSGGTWLVSKATICALISLASQNGGVQSTPPGC